MEVLLSFNQTILDNLLLSEWWDYMEQWRKNLYVLWFGTFIAAMSFSLVTPFLPLFVSGELNMLDNIELWSGVLISVSFIASATMSPIWGSLADKYGRKIMIIRSGLGIGFTYLLSAFTNNIWVFLFLRFLMGVLSGFIPSSIALVATNTPEDKISRSLGILQTGIAAGSISGPLIGGLLSFWFGIRETIFISGLIILFGTIVVIFGVKETAVRSKERTNIFRDLKIGLTNRELMIALLILMGVQASLYMIQPILPLYIGKIIAPDADVSLMTGIVFSLIGIATIIAAPAWADKGAKVGFKRILQFGLLGGAIFNATQLIFPNIYFFSASRFIFGLFIAGVMPAINSIIAKSVTPSFRGRAFGISTSFNQFGLALGPMLGGGMAKIFSLKAPFLISSLFFIITVIYLKFSKAKISSKD